MKPAGEKQARVSKYGGMLKWSEGKLVEQPAEPYALQEQALRARDEAVRWTIWLAVGGALFLVGLEFSIAKAQMLAAAFPG